MSLKLGFEIEFMVAYRALRTRQFAGLREHMDGRWPEAQPAVDIQDYAAANFANRQCIYKIASIIAQLGYPAACLNLSPRAEVDLITTVYGGEIRMVENEELRVWNHNRRVQYVDKEKFSYWFIDLERYISGNFADNTDAGAPGGYDWYNVELVAPVLGDPREFASGLPTVRHVLDTIRDQAKIWLNDDCGFHLHASPCASQLDTQTACGVAALTFLLENMLYKWCHPDRYHLQFSRPLQLDSGIGKDAHPVRVPDAWSNHCVQVLHAARQSRTTGFMPQERYFFQKVCTILEQPDMYSLQTGLYASYNSVSHPIRLGLCVSDHNTLEFRYPEARFDMQFISFWVDVISALFAFAQSPPEQFAIKLAEFYIMATAPTEMSGDHWLITLGLGRYSRFIQALRNRYQNEWSDLNAPVILRKPRDDPPAI